MFLDPVLWVSSSSEGNMLKLYGGARSRATIVQWYLEELGVPYAYQMLDMQSGEHRQPTYLEINPFGKVPAIVDGNLKLWESGAILIYLAEKYDQSLTVEDRAVITQWVLFANATLGPGLFVEATREREMPRLLEPLNQLLERQPFLVGNRLTAADIAVGSMLLYAPLMLGLDYKDYPAIPAYTQRLVERPAGTKIWQPGG
ncbi:MAG: glutathione S-transferase family protein [Leptolyngbyaceae cyanobacterium bins.59]|nr:glutathione S-transferase family protein [Leptolyngbyaceae cyanobacterium bins.59]